MSTLISCQEISSLQTKFCLSWCVLHCNGWYHHSSLLYKVQVQICWTFDIFIGMTQAVETMKRRWGHGVTFILMVHLWIPGEGMVYLSLISWLLMAIGMKELFVQILINETSSVCTCITLFCTRVELCYRQVVLR